MDYYYDILYGFVIFYMILLLSTMCLYLRTMYIQYKNAHDKWYDINNSPRKRC